jgi:hypothetical protein
LDNRTLVAFGMLLALVAFALQKHAVDGNAVEKIVIFLSGGITGAMVPRQQASGRETSRTVAALLLVLGALFVAGCSNLAPYVGPPGPPTVDGVEWLWPDIDGKWRRETTLLVTNKNAEPLDSILECTPHGHGHQSRNWPGSRFTLHVPPRTTMSVLLHPRDHNCELLPSDGE